MSPPDSESSRATPSPLPANERRPLLARLGFTTAGIVGVAVVAGTIFGAAAYVTSGQDATQQNILGLRAEVAADRREAAADRADIRNHLADIRDRLADIRERLAQIETRLGLTAAPVKQDQSAQ